MSVRTAQNQIRKQYGVGKGELHRRMRVAWQWLDSFWEDAIWHKPVDAETKAQAHEVVDALAADSIIATAYREAEIAAIETLTSE